jgi:phospholipid transport system substrate-binding protein
LYSLESNVPGGTIMETIRSAALLLSLTLGPACLAAQEAPDALLRNATNDYVAGLKEDSELAGDPSRSESLFKARMAPVFDFSRMTQLAMHRNWRLASARQQDRLTAEFKSVLLRAYSAAFASASLRTRHRTSIRATRMPPCAPR